MNRLNTKYIKRFILPAALLAVTARAQLSDDITLSTCPNTANDSQQDDLGNVSRIRSEATVDDAGVINV